MKKMLFVVSLLATQNGLVANSMADNSMVDNSMVDNSSAEITTSCCIS